MAFENFGVHITQLTYLLFCLSSCFTETSTSSFKEYQHLKDLFPVNSLDSIVQDKTLFDCTRDCYEAIECVTFLFNKSSKECLAHNVTLLTIELSTAPGWVHYRFYTKRCPYEMNYTYNRQLDLCLKHYTELKVHNESESTCAKDGARLVYVISDQMSVYLAALLEEHNGSKVFIYGNYIGNSTWVNPWGDVMTYFNWAPSHPVDNRNCICLRRHARLLWKTCVCTQENSFVCELP